MAVSPRSLDHAWSGTSNRPKAISADGSVIVGRADGVGAMRWTEATGIVALGGTEAMGVSGDGSVVAGYYGSPPAPFRWTADTGFVGLENLPGFPGGKATDVSADGSFLLGYSNFNGAQEPILQDAWLWSDSTGTRQLVDVLVNDHQIDLGEIGDYRRLKINDISDDARVLVGFIERPDSTTDKGWVAILDRPLFSVPAADFSNDGFIDCTDVDSLVAEIVAGTDNPIFDLTGDTVVDQADLNAWLTQAGAANLPSGNPYLPGDANLDGFVDASDFNIWNSNRLSQTPAWCAGDFTADGAIDASDFNVWKSHRFMSSDGLAAVPEPGAGVLAIIALVLAAGGWHRRASKALLAP